MSLEATRIAVIGGGSWGTSLSIYLRKLGFPVNLWVFEKDLVERILVSGENTDYFAGFPLPPNIKVTNDMAEAVHSADLVLSAVPSHVCRSVYGLLLPLLEEQTIFLSATKGIENETLLCMSELYLEIGGRSRDTYAVISGPSFAAEVAQGLPTAVVIASENMTLARRLQKMLSSPSFRLYTNNDLRGVELSGAIKNIIAIATGICHGLRLGANAEAALITRGLAEIGRLVEATGGKKQTVTGLAGAGDLILTCKGKLSRNRRVGIRLGQGEKLDHIIQNMNMIAEGIKTTKSVYALGNQHGIDMPITKIVFQVLYEDKNPEAAVSELMKRELKEEW